MPSVTVSKIDKEANGRILIYFGKHGREFGSIEQMQQSVRAAFTRDDMIDLSLRLMLARQSTLGSPAAFEGHSINIDPSLNNWGTFT